jgi:hypothetical protein
MHLNNTFTPDFKQVGGVWQRWPREGVMIHLGNYEDPPGPPPDPPRHYATYVEMQVDGDRYPTSGDRFFWANVTSDFKLPPNTPEPKKREPMPAALGRFLYPNASTGIPCYVENEDCCQQRLHPLLEPKAMITFWAGSKGYKVAAQSTDEAEPWNLTFEFAIEDSVEIEVFLVRPGTPPVFESQKKYRKGVHSIQIVAVDPQQHSPGLNPPWP